MNPRYSNALLCDFYEFTMGNGYFANGMKDTISCFDLFFRKVPDQGGFAIAAGLETVIQYIQDLHFTPEDIEYLRSKHTFSEKFLEYLAHFEFTCDIDAVEEGTPVFPNEPIITVKGPAIQAQLLETMLLLSVNHQSLIATKAHRIVTAAQGRDVFEFGSRRAQGNDAAILGARAAYIGGCAGTACSICEPRYGIPAVGTMAHAWVQMFPSEYDAFRAYAELYPDGCTLLIDTYNVLKSGLPNAIRVHKEILQPTGHRLKGIRIDSGDVAYLSKKARNILDEAGMKDCKIFISNSLDEYIIRDILSQGAKIDYFGVGERLITSRSEPVFGGVYKLVAIEKNGTMIPKIKCSENVEKITTPCEKKVYRLFSNATGKMEADLIAVADETFDFTQPITLFHPDFPWKRKTFENYTAKPLLCPIYRKGKLVYSIPSAQESRQYCMKQTETLWEEIKRFENPENYYVDLSEKLWQIKRDLLVRNHG